MLQEDIRDSAKELGYTHRRMRDAIGKFGSASPFDELISTNTCNLCLECKMLSERESGNPKSFPFKKVSEDQQLGLKEWDKCQINKSYILINFRWIDHQKGKCFALPIIDYFYLKSLSNEEKEDIDINEKSITLKYFKKNVLELPRLGKGWDLRLLI